MLYLESEQVFFGWITSVSNKTRRDTGAVSFNNSCNTFLMLFPTKPCLDPHRVGLESITKGEPCRCASDKKKKNQSINNFKGVKGVESKPFVPDSHRALPNGLMLPFCPCILSEFARVLWLLAAYSALLPNNELSFKYHGGSLVCLPLRWEAECKFLKIGLSCVGLE